MSYAYGQLAVKECARISSTQKYTFKNYMRGISVVNANGLGLSMVVHTKYNGDIGPVYVPPGLIEWNDNFDDFLSVDFTIISGTGSFDIYGKG